MHHFTSVMIIRVLECSCEHQTVVGQLESLEGWDDRSIEIGAQIHIPFSFPFDFDPRVLQRGDLIRHEHINKMSVEKLLAREDFSGDSNKVIGEIIEWDGLFKCFTMEFVREGEKVKKIVSAPDIAEYLKHKEIRYPKPGDIVEIDKCLLLN